MADKNFKVKSGLNLPITSAAILTTDASGNISSTSALAITNGGTGQTSANNALNALLPIQNGGTVNYTIQSDGTNVSWAKVYNQLIQNSGVSVTPRRIINFVGATLTDDSGTDTTTIDLSDKSSLSSANTFTTSPQTINAAASAVGLIVKGNATTPGNLQEWRDSSGTALASVSSAGAITFVGGTNSGTITGGAFTTGNNTFSANSVSIQNNSGVTQLRVLQNTVAQTAEIARFVGNAGTSNSVFTNAGQLVTGGTTSATASYTITMSSASFTSTTATFTYASSAQLVAVGQKVILAGFTPSGYNGTYQIASVATVSAGVSYSFTVANTTNTAFSVSTGTAQFTPGNTATALGAAVTPLVVKSVASQAANLQEWQGSDGTVLARIANTGQFLAPSIVGTNFQITSGGVLYVGGASYTAQANIQSLSASTISLIVKGVASQTADLQQWQNSSGTVLSGISSAGDYLALQGTLLRCSTGSVFGSLQLLNGGTNESIFNPSSAGLLINNSGVTGMTVVKVRGASGQTANLQEWQNSAGTVLASINASGDLSVQNFTVNGTTTTVNSTTLTISDKNIEISKVASPTDITADGAGITIKGTTDKTFNWVQSTAAFTSSEPISAPAFKSAGTAVSSNITLLSGYKYYVDTTAARTLTLPASPSLGDEIVIYDASNSALTNNITVLPNGNKVQGSIQTLIVDSNAAVAYLAYTGSTYGWAVN